jgi:hypothetical protein
MPARYGAQTVKGALRVGLARRAQIAPSRVILAAMVTYEVTATGSESYQVTVVSPEWRGAIVGNFSSLSAAEAFAESMRTIDAGDSHVVLGDPS